MKKVLSILTVVVFFFAVSAPVYAVDNTSTVIVNVDDEKPKTAEAKEDSKKDKKKSSDCSSEAKKSEAKKSSDCSSKKKSKSCGDKGNK
jgi:uncharacterized protein YxeA